jgi:hypothetical protein
MKKNNIAHDQLKALGWQYIPGMINQDFGKGTDHTVYVKGGGPEEGTFAYYMTLEHEKGKVQINNAGIIVFDARIDLQDIDQVKTIMNWLNIK